MLHKVQNRDTSYNLFSNGKLFRTNAGASCKYKCELTIDGVIDCMSILLCKHNNLYVITIISPSKRKLDASVNKF